MLTGARANASRSAEEVGLAWELVHEPSGE